VGWTLYVENSTGTTMDIPYIALFEPTAPCGRTATGRPPASPSRRRAVAGRHHRGTFTATLATKSTPPETVVVTNGAFEVRRNRGMSRRAAIGPRRGREYRTMRKLDLGLLTIALFAASQAACGADPRRATGRSSGSDGAVRYDGPANDAANAADFVTGDADGTTFRAALMPQAGLQGLADGMIWMTAGTTSTTRGWTVYIPNSVGTHACTMQTWIMLLETVGGRTDAQGAGCSVTVTRGRARAGRRHRGDLHSDAGFTGERRAADRRHQRRLPRHAQPRLAPPRTYARAGSRYQNKQ
jgi:hypothetical protein